MKVNDNDQNILNEIHRKFSELATLHSELSPEVNQIIYDLHEEHFTLNHCIRWGEIGISEVIDELHL